jgi:hypothetical protein
LPRSHSSPCRLPRQSDSVGNSLTLNVTGTACRTASGYAFDGSYTVNAGGGAYANTGVGTGAAKFTVTGQSMHGVFAGSFDPAQERAEDGMPE